MNLRLICVLAIFAATAANAATSKKSHESQASEKEQAFSVAVPKSQMDLEPLRYVPPRPVDVEMGISSWEPENFARGSYSGRVSKFERSGVPSLSLNRLGEIYAWSSGLILRSKLGLSYMALERSETSLAGGLSTGSSVQTLNMFSGRAGFELAWTHLLPWNFEPSVSVAVLPTILNGDQSEFEKGVSAFGTPWEATLGLFWRSNLMGQDIGAGVAGHAVRGSVGGSSLAGYGVQGAFRISL